MQASIIKQRIRQICNNYDIIILKGFPISDILNLTDEFHLLDHNIIENSRINLNKIKSVTLFQDIVTHESKEICLLTYESFLELTTMIRKISALHKRFCILTNNLLTKYENQTTESIPDFDSNEFQDDQLDNSSYAKFYSFCMHINNKQYIQYIEYFIDDMEMVQNFELFIPTQKFKIHYLLEHIQHYLLRMEV